MIHLIKVSYTVHTEITKTFMNLFMSTFIEAIYRLRQYYECKLLHNIKIYGNVAWSTIRSLQYHEVLWFHNIDKTCICTIYSLDKGAIIGLFTCCIPLIMSLVRYRCILT